ncbi:hypothetical protein ACP70R_009670 [Stipagrostis hirtigluma subsp. patula]
MILAVELISCSYMYNLAAQPSGSMEDSSLFMLWAMNTLRHDHPVADTVNADGGEATFPSLQALREASAAAEVVYELTVEAHAANSRSSGDGDTTHGSSVAANTSAAMDQDIWPPSPATARPAPRTSSSATNRPMSWTFTAAPAPPGSHCVQPTRRAGLKIAGSMSSATYAQDHIIAERKRREKINQRFIELSTVIPSLKKMDKATILSDATRYVKELQEKVKALEDGSDGRSIIESVVLHAKKPCTAVPDEGGSPSWESPGTPPVKKSLPEIEARLSEKSVMVRIHCEDGKGVVVRMLAEVEELRLSIVQASVIPFSACTLIITITAKVEESFTGTPEEIVGKLNSALLHDHSSYNSKEETEN